MTAPSPSKQPLPNDYAEALVETMQESLIILDPELRIRRANSVFHETFGISPTEAEGERLLELGGGWVDSQPAIRALLDRVAAKGESVRDYEFQVEFPGLGRKTLVGSARRLNLPGDTEPLVLIAIKDVTEAQRATAALQASETRYRLLFETAREAIWLLDAVTGEILDANPFVTELFGFTRDELLGKNVWDLPLYVDPEAARKRFRNTVTSGYRFSPDVAMRTRDGRVLRVEKISSVYSAGDRTIVQSYMRDMTERMRLEEDLRHAQRMESIGRLAGGIAHDFNNILNIISAYSSLLVKSGDSAKRAQSSEAIEKAVQRGAALVRQLLTFARRETIRFEPVDVNAVVTELASMVGETFPPSVRIVLDLAPVLPPIQADPTQLHQALLNLAVNARDAMPDGGSVRFTTAVAHRKDLHRIPDAREDRYVCVGVVDDGRGMDEKTLNRIFEPFFTTKGKEHGSGLGLAVVYGIANSHSGFVDVVSEPGKGSHFSLYIPIRAPGEGPDATRVAEEPASERETTRRSPSPSRSGPPRPRSNP